MTTEMHKHMLLYHIRERLHENPIILALDGLDKPMLKELTKDPPPVSGLKVNDLLDWHGAGILSQLRCGTGYYDMLMMADPKLKDVPRTIERRMSHYVWAGANLVTVMADSGDDSLKAAVEAAGDFLVPVAVTVLTSISDAGCTRMYNRKRRDAVLFLAEGAMKAGFRALVCSPEEVSDIRSEFGSEQLCITPGIRMPGQDPEDQKAIGTPANAIKAGADGLVIGSAILRPEGEMAGPDRMRQAAEDILTSI